MLQKKILELERINYYIFSKIIVSLDIFISILFTSILFFLSLFFIFPSELLEYYQWNIVLAYKGLVFIFGVAFFLSLIIFFLKGIIFEKFLIRILSFTSFSLVLSFFCLWYNCIK